MFHALCLNCCFGSSAYGARTLEMICMFLVPVEFMCCFCRLQITLDNSGTYAASSCSDKTVSIAEFDSGECVASMSGHSGEL